MKIISWNLWGSNRHVDKSLKLAFRENPDVVCFQEVMQESKYLLKKYPKYSFFFAEDFLFPKKGKMVRCDLVIGIKKKYRASFKKVGMSNKKLANIIARITYWKEAVEFCYIDFKKGREKFRLFNIHLSCAANPERRKKEILQVFRHKSLAGNNIFCGDFNTFARIRYNFLIGWLFGFRLRELLCNEFCEFGRLFKKERLINIFRGNITYPLFGLQLDHILIPDGFECISKKVHKKSMLYSDHFMVSAVIKKKG